MQLLVLLHSPFLSFEAHTNYLADWLTSMIQDPWEGESHSTSQEIFPPYLWNLNIQCSVHKNPPGDPTLNNMNPLFLYPIFTRSCKSSLHYRFSNWTCICISYLFPCILHAPPILKNILTNVKSRTAISTFEIVMLVTCGDIPVNNYAYLLM